MIPFLLWYLFITLIGWMVIPISFRLFSKLPDRGYFVSRALGMLLWGYIFWLFTSLGMLRNNLGGLLFSLIVLISFNVYLLRNLGMREIIAVSYTHLTLPTKRIV